LYGQKKSEIGVSYRSKDPYRGGKGSTYPDDIKRN